MKPSHLILLLVLVAIFAGCGEANRPTPTPFPGEDIAGEAQDSNGSLAISIADLAADPEAYVNQFIELTGQYRRLPLLVCQTDPYPSPATWQLMAEDGSLIAVGGFDAQVRSLLPNDLTMTVAGVWQQFEGPVGCGKNAISTQIWYLKASDIVSPSPIARVTLTPTGPAGTEIAEADEGTAVTTPDEQGDLPPTPTLAPGDDGAEPTSTPTLASTTIPAPPGGTATATLTAPSSGTGGPGGGPTDTPTRDANETGTPTPTGGANGTPTATNGTSTPTGSANGTPTATSAVFSTATRNPTDFDTVEFDDLSPEIPVLELLSVEEAHLWPIVFENSGAITITAVAEPSVNLVLEIIDPANDVVQQANSGGNGELESIVNAQLNTALDYDIRVYNLNATEGEYCLIFSEAGGFPDSIKGRMEYGQTVNDTVEVLAINYWCFVGNSGDNITISASATGDEGDFVLGLFGPPDFEAIGDPFSSSEITNVALTEDGMYLIGILDFEAGEADYSISLRPN